MSSPANEKIDVVMPTWNSNSPHLEDVICAVRDRLPLHHLIVVDRYSNDGTIQVIRENIPKDKLILIKSDSSLAVARKMGISKADTRWFAFVDSDVEITSDWYEGILSVIDEFDNWGMIQPRTERTSSGGSRIELLNPSKKVNLSDIFFHGMLNQIRLATTHTLIRREAVMDWNPPPRLSALEDYHLTQHIIKGGWRAIRLKRPLGIEHKMPSKKEGLKHGAWHGAGCRNTHACSFLEALVQSGCRGISSVVSNNLEAVFFQIGFLAGYLLPERYTEYSRSDNGH